MADTLGVVLRMLVIRRGALLFIVSLLSAKSVVAQAPGSGWATVPTPERTVKTLYWQLFHETEVWTRVVPTSQSGDSIPMSLIFVAILPGKVDLPVKSAQAPREVTLLVQPSPLALLTAASPSLQFTTRGGVLDLIRLGIANVVPSCDGCGSQPIRAVLDRRTFDEIANSGNIHCNIWNVGCELSQSDTDAIRAFARTIAINP
jgi:hypothetical protein